MMELDEDALVCDFAETYQIYDYRSLPLRLAATLAAGLRDDSRIKMLAAGMPVTQEELLLAAIADRVELFRYGFTKDAERGLHAPQSLVEKMCGMNDKSREIAAFGSPEAFEKARERILRKAAWQEQH